MLCQQHTPEVGVLHGDVQAELVVAQQPQLGIKALHQVVDLLQQVVLLEQQSEAGNSCDTH